MNDGVFPQFERLIAARTGLQLRAREREALRRLVTERSAALRLPDAISYRVLLDGETPQATREWEYLTAHLTNNESYFFRDRGQMTLLREQILPELIERNRERRTLRVWSAGCATGEEAYSLAILVQEALTHQVGASGTAWEIVLRGTDIDEPALQQARQGFYSDWSFRTVDPALRQQYFVRQANGWQIAEAVQRMVTFSRCNLFTDRFPQATAGLYDMDLILCRNVFIYFAEEAVKGVLAKFGRTLRDGGYLMTGHAETQGRTIEPLQLRRFPESIVYQCLGPTAHASVRPAVSLVDTLRPRVSAERSTGNVARLPVPIPAPGRVAEVQEEPACAQGEADDQPEVAAETLYIAGDYNGVLQALTVPAIGWKGRLLRAHAYANLGRYEEAAESCRQLQEASPFAPEPYELLATLAQEQGRSEEAKTLLKQAVYLAPNAPTAYMELAALYAREGDRNRARRLRVTALELLQQMPADAPLGFPTGPAVAEWRTHLKSLLAQEGV